MNTVHIHKYQFLVDSIVLAVSLNETLCRIGCALEGTSVFILISNVKPTRICMYSIVSMSFRYRRSNTEHCTTTTKQLSYWYMNVVVGSSCMCIEYQSSCQMFASRVLFRIRIRLLIEEYSVVEF